MRAFASDPLLNDAVSALLKPPIELLLVPLRCRRVVVQRVPELWVTRPSNVGVSAAITNLGFVAVGGSTENSNNVGVNGTSTGNLGGSGAAYTFK